MEEIGDPDSDASFTGTASGHVQGVGYRAFAAGIASSLGLHGWVRNLPDGRVAFAFRGRRKELGLLVLALGSGPLLADVAELELDWTKGPDDETGLEVRG